MFVSILRRSSWTPTRKRVQTENMLCESDLLDVDVVGTGFTVLDRIYADGDFAAEELGGSCGNVLVSLAMLRRHVAPPLAPGLAALGPRLVEEFRRTGADTRRIRRLVDLLPQLTTHAHTTTS